MHDRHQILKENTIRIFVVSNSFLAGLRCVWLFHCFHNNSGEFLNILGLVFVPNLEHFIGATQFLNQKGDVSQEAKT